MATRIHTNEIINQIMSLLKTQFEAAEPTGLGLKMIAKGTLESYTSESGLSLRLPAICIMPSGVTELEFVAFGQEYDVEHNFKIVYIRKSTVTEDVWDELITESLRVAEFLIDEMLLDDLSLSNGQIIHSIPSAIDWEPDEDDLVAGYDQDLRAVAINFQVTVRTQRV